MSKLKEYWPIILLVVVILGGLFWWYERGPSLRDCQFELKLAGIDGVKYGNHTLADFYSGTIKNKSSNKEYLKAMIIKFYDKDDILLQEGYREIGNTLPSHTGVNFSVNVQVGSEDRRQELRNSRVDIYPWFLTCK